MWFSYQIINSVTRNLHADLYKKILTFLYAVGVQTNKQTFYKYLCMVLISFWTKKPKNILKIKKKSKQQITGNRIK